MIAEAVATLAASLESMTVDTTHVGGLSVPNNLRWRDGGDPPRSPDDVKPQHKRAFWLEIQAPDDSGPRDITKWDRGVVDAPVALTVAYYGRDTLRRHAEGLAHDDAARILRHLPRARPSLSAPSGFTWLGIGCESASIDSDESGGVLLTIQLTIRYSRTYA